MEYLKRFAWVQNAVQALAIDVKGSVETDDNEQESESDQDFYKENEILETAPKAQESMSKSRSGFAPVKSCRISQHSEPTVDVWNDSVTSLNRTQKPAASHSAKSKPSIWHLASNGSVKKVKNEVSTVFSTHSFREPLHDVSLSSKNNSAAMACTSESQNLKFKAPPKPTIEKPNLPTSKATSSVIFQNSRKAPITIILTAAADEDPAESQQSNSSHKQKRNPFNEIRNTRNSSIPLPPHKPLTIPPVQTVDKTLLMPPTEHALDTRRIRQAQECREIRGFMIDFVNMKGDILPEQLRTQMMQLYGIQQVDLHPETVAKFNSKTLAENCQDEEMMLGEKRDSEEHLRILETAFRSRLEDMTPKRQTAPVRPQPTPKQNLESKKSNTRSRSETSIATSADYENVPLAWLGPLISSDIAPSPHSLTKSRSRPNLRNTTKTPIEERQKQSQEVDNTPVRRNRTLSGAFGVVREVMLGRKKSMKS